LQNVYTRQLLAAFKLSCDNALTPRHLPDRMLQWQTHSEHPVQRLQAVFLTAPERGQDAPDMDVAVQRRAGCTKRRCAKKRSACAERG